MFEGEHQVNMDEKGRISIPAAYRDVLRNLYTHETIVITRDFDGCLRVYPQDEWYRHVQKFHTQPQNSPEIRAYERVVISAAVTTQPDKQGRILINHTLRKHAGLIKHVTFAGGSGRFQIWDVERRDVKLMEDVIALQQARLDF
ncbi:MAG: division/cell wall cluster transcriptional repressor MraZ [Zetaproteobacteria bacterium]|nr:division/cell wall cluster transcriptional repressor MraZ [Zetaproteobacteria bacterium]